MWGSPKTNKISGKFLERINDRQPAVQKESSIYWRNRKLNDNWIRKGTKRFLGKVKNGKVISDYGLIVRATNPFRPEDSPEKRTVVLFSGSHTYGTMAAARYFVEVMHRKFGFRTLKKNNIVVLVKAQVEGRWPEQIEQVNFYKWKKK